MESHLPGGLGVPKKGTLTGEVLLLEFSNVNVAWMRFVWTFGTFAIVMLTRMNGNGNHDFCHWGGSTLRRLAFLPRVKNMDEKFSMNLGSLMNVIVFNFEKLPVLVLLGLLLRFVT